MEHKFDDRFSNNNLQGLLDKALKNSQERELEAKENSMLDPATRTGNRLALDKFLPDMINRLSGLERRSADIGYLVVLFVDINKFKVINDTLGHDVGNIAMSAIVGRLKEEARAHNGEVFRYGGDEFVVVQSGKGDITDDEQSIAKRVQDKVNADLSIPTNEGKLPLSVSIGCAVAKKGEDITAAELLKKADERMYKEKHSSRVEVAR